MKLVESCSCCGSSDDEHSLPPLINELTVLNFSIARPDLRVATLFVIVGYATQQSHVSWLRFQQSVFECDWSVETSDLLARSSMFCSFV